MHTTFTRERRPVFKTACLRIVFPFWNLKFVSERSDVAIGEGSKSSFAFLIVVKLMAVILCPPERVEKVLEGAVAEVEIGSDAGEASL